MYKNILLLILTLSTLTQADFFDFQTIEKANKAYQKGNYIYSAKLFGSLKKDDPTVAYDKANALYKAGNYDEALREYAKAKGVNEAQRLHNIGNCYFKKQDLDRAIESYERALKIREDKDTRYNLELAKKKKREKEKKKNNKNKKKNKDKKKQNKKKEKNNQKKKEDKKKPKKEKQDEKKKRDEKTEKPMTPEQKRREEIRKKELKHMMNKLSKKKMPTLMYQPNRKKGEPDDTQNPW